MAPSASCQTASSRLPAVILAAGRGERLHGHQGNGLKPLTPLLGITLLERAVLACQSVGVTDCYIVIGYGHERMQAHIANLSGRYHMRLHPVPSPNWHAGNGVSALAAQPYIDRPFLLLMCDHVFDAEILQRLIEAGQTSEACLLAVDDRIEEIFDLDDATKVQRNGSAITAIGKELTTYNSIDTGLFWCQPALFQALTAAQEAGDASLSGGIRRVIAAANMQVVPIADQFWMDIDTAECLAQAEQVMLKRLA